MKQIRRPGIVAYIGSQTKSKALVEDPEVNWLISKYQLTIATSGNKTSDMIANR